jgi:hypothetical protein
VQFFEEHTITARLFVITSQSSSTHQISTTNNMMHPGRFPSPTPSREASPVNFTRNLGSYPYAKHRIAVPDFTQPISARKRPRFTETQSDTAVEHEDLSYPCLPSTSQRATEKRRASDPLQHGLQTHTLIDADANTQQAQRQRVFSTPSISRPPRSPPRSAQQSSLRSPRSIDIQLREKLHELLTPKDQVGIIYVLRDPRRPDKGYKIGCCRRADYQKRIAEHRERCDFEPKVVHTVHDVENAFRTEQLILLDLKDRQVDVTCNGRRPTQHSSKHIEWFQVTEEVAKETVEKWTRFMRDQQPYDKRRELGPSWRYLIRARKSTNLDNIDHDARRKQWSSILAPATHLDYLFFVADVFCRAWDACVGQLLLIWPFFWQSLTVAYSFVTLLVFRNTFASSTFALVSVCAYVSAARYEPPKRVRSKGIWG